MFHDGLGCDRVVSNKWCPVMSVCVCSRLTSAPLVFCRQRCSNTTAWQLCVLWLLSLHTIVAVFSIRPKPTHMRSYAALLLLFACCEHDWGCSYIISHGFLFDHPSEQRMFTCAGKLRVSTSSAELRVFTSTGKQRVFTFPGEQNLGRRAALHPIRGWSGVGLTW